MIKRTVTFVAEIHGAMEWIQDNLTRGVRGGAVIITLGREKRSTAQNRKMWPLLHDLSEQLVYAGKKRSKEQWKAILTAAWRRLECVPNIEGDGVVFFGIETSKLNKADFSDLIESIYAYGSEHNIKWSEQSEEIYMKARGK